MNSPRKSRGWVGEPVVERVLAGVGDAVQLLVRSPLLSHVPA